jgi:uncharacterized protein YggE
MKKIITLCIPFLLSFVICRAQIAGNSLYNNGSNQNVYNQQGLYNGVNLNLDPAGSYLFSTNLEASVMMNVKASAYVAIFSLTQHAATIEEADKMMEDRISALKSMLALEKIPSNQVFIDPISLVPTYETEVVNKKYSRTYNEIPAGFEMKKNIHITFKDQEYINRIITLAAKAEIYDLVKADYVIDDLDNILDQLRNDALSILLHKKAMIEKAGIYTRLIQVGEKYGSAYPQERYQQYYAYKTGTPQVYASNYRKNPVQDVQYNYAEKNKTIYYEKVSDKQFDKVINPLVGEPMVQVYLSVKSQYQVYDPVTEASDKAYNERMRAISEKEAALRLLEKEKTIQQIGKPVHTVQPQIRKQ